MGLRVPAALLALALAGCGADEPVVLRTRLADCTGRLVEPVQNDAARLDPVLREEFDATPADWIVITDKKDVLAVDAQALRQSCGREGERTFLTLGGRAGALYTMLPVEGDTPYLFRGVLRARDVKPLAENFSGATFWLAEASVRGSPKELFEREKRFDRRLPV